jgi:hypothetical protein
MKEKIRRELIERANNFNWNWDKDFLEDIYRDKRLFEHLYDFFESTDIKEYSDFINKTSISLQPLDLIFTEVFNTAIFVDDEYKIFQEDTPFYSNMYDAYYFTSLCSFLHSTKRIKAMSLRDFLYNNSSYKYNVKGTPLYFDLNKHGKGDVKSEGYGQIRIEEDTLRQKRHRLLKNRPVYIKKTEWSAMSADSEYEWSFLYVLNSLDDDLADTYKRLGNLYNDVNKVLEKENPSKEDLEYAYNKFYSKLKKIKYNLLLEIQKRILEHVNGNKRHYGINLYRFEKELRLYNIANEVKNLLECKNETEENSVLKRISILNDIYFPNVYRDFCIHCNPDNIGIGHYASAFRKLKGVSVFSCCLNS